MGGCRTILAPKLGFRFLAILDGISRPQGPHRIPTHLPSVAGADLSVLQVLPIRKGLTDNPPSLAVPLFGVYCEQPTRNSR